MQADEWNKKTILTVSEPLQLPTQVLQPGKYVMLLSNSQSDRHIVMVYDEDQKHLITTILAIPNYRLQPTGKTAFQFWETPAGQPKALRAWFYPGDNFGQEFAYPKNLSVQIAAYTKTAVPTTSESDNLTTARVDTTDDQGKSAELDKNVYTAPPAETTTQVAAAPAPSPEPAPVPAATVPAEPVQTAQLEPQQPMPDRSAVPAELPRTASNLPLIGLIGLISIAGALGLTLAGKKA
jgi:hypothetical protein